jgi:hypothetical protein
MRHSYCVSTYLELETEVVQMVSLVKKVEVMVALMVAWKV